MRGLYSAGRLGGVVGCLAMVAALVGPAEGQIVVPNTGAGDPFVQLGGNSISFDLAADRFVLEDDAEIQGSLEAGDVVTSHVFARSLRLSASSVPGEGDTAIFFFEDGLPLGESLQWRNLTDQFELSDDLQVIGDLEASSVRSYGDLYVNHDGPSGNSSVYFYNGASPTTEFLRFHSGLGYFVLSDDLSVSDLYASRFADTSVIEMHSDIDDNESGVDAWRLWVDSDGINDEQIAEFTDGGSLRIAGSVSSGAAFDLAEKFVRAGELAPGDVVRVVPGRPHAVERARIGEAGAVIGVVSTDPGMVLGGAVFRPERLAAWEPELVERFRAEVPALRRAAAGLRPELHGDERDLESAALDRFVERELVAVAVAGRVPVRVDATAGPIGVGDPLAPGPTPGVAVRAVGPGRILGSALEALEEGEGTILAWIEPGWYPGGIGDGAGPAGPVSGVWEAEPARERSTGGGDRTLGPTAAAPAAATLETVGAGVAEHLTLSGPVEAGDVLVADREHPGLFRAADAAEDPAVVGVVAGEPGVVTGTRVAALGALVPELAEELATARAGSDRAGVDRAWARLREAFDAVHAPVALAGTVEVKVDAAYGAVRVGDLLTTSPTPGHAMRVEAPAPGTILGKALGPLPSGRGRIRMLVMLR